MGDAPQDRGAVEAGMRRALLLFVLALLLPVPAAAQDILAAVRAEHWAEADALAAASPDPLVPKLVLYFRLLTPGAARVPDLASFIADNPAWPQQALLRRRLNEALAAESDDRVTIDHCQQQPALAQQTLVLLHCADAASRAGHQAEAEQNARAAWVKNVEPAAELAFIRTWGRVLTADDQWRRFDRLAWTDSGLPGSPAARQAVRVAPVNRPATEARLALRRDDPSAPALVAALPASARNDPAMTLDLAKWYRRAGQDRTALTVWAKDGSGAEAAAPGDRRPAFWDERNLLARRMLRTGDAAAAYALASRHHQSGEAAIDAEFLSGWIALRRLEQPGIAAQHFQTLAGLSRAAITQGRAHYWIGRAAAAQGDAEGAQAAYAQAAAWPTTYYGQLAARALGEDDATLAARIRGAQDPAWSVEQAAAFTGRELARAAVLLMAWGEPRRARAFLQRLDETARDEAERAMAAHLALGFGLPDQAVAIARRAGRDGLMLPDAGWPAAVEPPADSVDPAVALGLIRQESSFDVEAGSPVGARGLMQLMPATAASVARRLNEAISVPALTADAGYNMRLGTVYLRGLLDQFGGALPLALAAYNAGPSRVQDWIAGYGDPLTGSADMVDWIELIPFNETRNYVQRVIENVVIYRARRGSTAPHPLARWGR